MHTTRRNALYIVSIALCMLTLFCGCGGMKHAIVNTKLTVSPGYKLNNTMYFLCEYVLSKPGKEIIPMYMSIPGNVYVHYLYLYKYSMTDETLVKISALELPDIPDIASTQWLQVGTVLYAMFPYTWDGKQRVNEIVSFSMGDSTFQKISDSEKETIRNKFQISKNNVLSTSQVLYYVDVIPLSQWDLPSPLTYCSLSKNKLIQTFIEGLGDSYFKEEAFNKLTAECSSKELMNIAIAIEKKYAKLNSYQQMEYAPYRDRWQTRFWLAAQYGKENNNGNLPTAIYTKNNSEAKKLLDQLSDCTFRDANGTTLLMIAAYTDNVEIASLLLAKKCNINARDNHGCTPLMYAVFGNAVHTMELLLKNNADVMMESSSKYIAWMYINNAGLRQRYLSVVSTHSIPKGGKNE